MERARQPEYKLSMPVAKSFALLLLCHLLLPAQKFDLSIDNIMRGPGLTGYEPREVRWSGDNQKIYFSWKQASDPILNEFDTYVINRDRQGLRKLDAAEAKLAPPFEGNYSPDRSLVVHVVDGDLFVYDLKTEKGRRLTQTRDIEESPRFLYDGRRISFTRDANLFVFSIETGAVRQLTDIRPPGSTLPPEQERTTEGQEFLKKEERELLESVRERAAKREREEALRKMEAPHKPHILSVRQTVEAMQLTPDEKYVIATISEGGERVRKTIVPAFVTESAYAETLPSRTNVGDAPAKTRLARIDVRSGEVKWIEHDIKETPLPKSTDAKPLEPAERNIALSDPLWSSDGKRAVVDGRSYDSKDRCIFALDLESARLRVLVSIHDDAWVDGPGDETLAWMKNDEEVYFQWERDGYSHLYVVPHAGGAPRQLTSGNFEVLSARLADDKSRFYLETNEAGPGERHLYLMSSAGGERTRITSQSGRHETYVSRDGNYVADVYSFVTRPPELYVQPNKPGATALKLTTSPAPEFWSYPWQDAPIVQIPARDGVKVPGRLYKPARPAAGRPAVIFVHGAGYLQNVHLGWSNYFREYMFHHFLMERGYTVLDIDYRGSAGYGRNWRTAIYRHMGGKDLDDQIDAARWLVSAHGVDPKRIGIYGGSYGGFITLMAMFTQPDTFAAGAALRPVTDWAHYNEEYTSNILNLPHSDAEAYRRSSPIYFAAGLKGALLICHGMVDTNVHYQDSVRLVQKLIELRKENWELASYPVEGHAFVYPASWADEYKRIFKLFETHLKPR